MRGTESKEAQERGEAVLSIKSPRSRQHSARDNTGWIKLSDIRLAGTINALFWDPTMGYEDDSTLNDMGDDEEG